MKVVLFAGLSLADFALTRTLLLMNALDEVNPVANLMLRQGGLYGLAAYKLSIVLLVLFLIWFISRTKRGQEKGYGNLVTYVAIFVTGIVVGWSAFLLTLL